MGAGTYALDVPSGARDCRIVDEWGSSIRERPYHTLTKSLKEGCRIEITLGFRIESIDDESRIS